MNWSFTLGLLAFCAGILGALFSFTYNRHRNRSFRPIWFLVFGNYFSALSLLFPWFFDHTASYIETSTDEVLYIGKTFHGFLLALQYSIRIFAIDIDYELVYRIGLDSPSRGALLSIVCFCAPLLTFAVVLSFFVNIIAHFRILLPFGNKYVFSELNEKSLCLAKDIIKREKHAKIVFHDVFSPPEEGSYELSEEARKLSAVLLKKDVVVVNYHTPRCSNITFFILGKNDTENLNQALKITEKYNDHSNVTLYVFSTRVECDILLENVDHGKIKVKRINEVRSLINNLLYEKGYSSIIAPTIGGEGHLKISDFSRDNNSKDKTVSAVIVGLGLHGTEMTKALSWYCQLPGYSLKINAFDIDSEAEEKFKLLCPDLLNDDWYGRGRTDDADYSVQVHSGFNVKTSKFFDEISKIDDVTYVLVCLGDDEINIATAIELRSLYERIGLNPVIQAVVYNDSENKALRGVENFKRQKYNIDFIGSLNSIYSYYAIMNSKLDNAALNLHLAYARVINPSAENVEKATSEFWKYSYLYQSSIARAIHEHLREDLFTPDNSLSEASVRKLWQITEKKRWNAYTRSIGYVWNGDQYDYSARNDLAKVHNLLVPFDDLPESEKGKNL